MKIKAVVLITEISMKKGFISATILACISLGLTSCVFFFDNSDPGSNFSYNTPEYTSVYTSSNMNKDYLASTIGQIHLPSTGDSRILVIPVQFTDDEFTTYELETLNNSFFGSSEDTGWESVSSYYRKSSSDQLKIQGRVIDPVNVKMTSTEFELEAKKYTGTGNFTDTLLTDILKFLADSKSFDFSEFDSNNDQVIDSVWMVYSCSYDSNSDLYWAYTTWAVDTEPINGYYANPYSWASIEFLYEGNYHQGNTNLTDKGDAHTFIHETGHLLGLDDYYSYDNDNTTNFDTPVGGVDMMDFNIGDHCSFSKYLLGWVDPIVITKEYLEEKNNEIKLTSFNETNQFLLIPPYENGEIKYNDTVLDEYLLVEFYTPTGLNEHDSTFKYTNGLKSYTKPGVLVYHVNASVGRIYVRSFLGVVSWDGYVYDKLPPLSSLSSSEGYYYIFSNTRSYSYYQMDDSKSHFYRGRLLSLLSSHGRKIEGNKTGYANDVCLYESGDKFMLDGGVYEDFIFDDGTVPQFGFEVKSTSNDSCVLRFNSL